ncbi:MAG: HlyD family type I secretion periplasmic adaptor subunit [Proteobacteria bacterium]|nr:HlyD family type I secretion periplasmic adaptor subunit [Pseudomonadota bacterium]
MSDDTATPETPEEPMTMDRGDRRARFLAQSVILGEDGGPALMRKAAGTTVIAVIALLAWAGFINVDDVITATGRVIPVGEAEAIRHKDGGTVSEILIKDSDIVDQGQILVRLDRDEAEKNLQDMQVRQVGIMLMAAGMRALSSGGKPDFSVAGPGFEKMVENERIIFASLRQLTGKSRQVLGDRVTQSKGKLKDFAKREKSLSRNADILEEELLLRKDLFKKGLTPKDVYEKTTKQVDQAHKTLAMLAEARKRWREYRSKSENQLAAWKNRQKSRALDELGILNTELDQINESLENLKERLKRLDITAPAKGFVKGLRIDAVGAVVEPGAVVVEIIPFGGEAVVETRIAAPDIGRVSAGQAVTVRVKADGFARYDGIKGELKEISASRFIDEKGVSYHKGIITLDRDYVGKDPDLNRLTPGMTVEAVFKTDSRPLFQYLLNAITGSAGPSSPDR